MLFFFACSEPVYSAWIMFAACMQDRCRPPTPPRSHLGYLNAEMQSAYWASRISHCWLADLNFDLKTRFEACALPVPVKPWQLGSLFSVRLTPLRYGQDEAQRNLLGHQIERQLCSWNEFVQHPRLQLHRLRLPLEGQRSCLNARASMHESLEAGHEYTLSLMTSASGWLGLYSWAHDKTWG